MARKSRTFLKYGLMVVVILALAELGSRALLIALDSFGPSMLAESIHCQHDPILGWSNIPGITTPDMYGPGRALTINNQGFRANHDFTRQAEEGTTRIVCLGDSFTLGYGVGDDETFCARLEASDPNLEVINMGQGGYGLDQMCLWYRKEWSHYSHKILLVCFIDADISRMNADRFDVYPKPWLQFDAQGLFPMNVPVPDFNQGFWDKKAWWSGLGVVKVARRVRESMMRKEKPKGVFQTQRDLLRTVMAVFRELDALAKSQDATMAIVRLPTAGNRNPDIPFYSTLNREIEATGYPYFDLVKSFRQLPLDTVDRMFIHPETAPKELLRFEGMSAHYSPFGHDVVAKWMLEMLNQQGLLDVKSVE